MTTTTCLAVIPARGGSKGIKNKNLRPVGGIPLVGRSIRACLASSKIDRVVVSTDHPEIAKVSRGLGAEVIERPIDLSGDTATSESAVLHALDVLQKNESYQPDITVLVQCTSPLTTSAELDGLISTLCTQSADSCFMAVPHHRFLWKRSDDSVVGVNHSGKKRQRRQDLEEELLETGAAYAMQTAIFKRERERFCGRVTAHVTPTGHAIEIDEPEDLTVARALVGPGDINHSLPTPLDAVVFDFDGVFTDNRVLVSQEGLESVFCSRGDGMGLELLRDSGVRILVLSKEKNPVVLARTKKLSLETLHGVDDKPTILARWMKENDTRASHTVYVGNDVNDLGCMEMCGCSVAPADAHASALSVADIVLSARGGHGAVREICDAIMTARKENVGA